MASASPSLSLSRNMTHHFMVNGQIRDDRRVDHEPERYAPPPPRSGDQGQWSTSIGRFVSQYPAVFLSAAVLAGVALGWFVKRR